MANKFQIKSRTWNLIAAIGSAVLIVAGFGGLFLLQGMDASATLTLWFVIGLGLVTFLFFAGPGIVYSARKRIKALKKSLPGGTMAWIRSHLYLPILALVAAFVHATVVPFQDALSSGKVLLVVGILVAIAGVARHHLIGVQKQALNVDVSISKIVDGQPRRFRQLAADLVEGRRPAADIEADVAQLGPEQQEVWREVRTLSDEVNKNFPRTGGQSRSVRTYKFLRAVHAPLTIVLFVLLGYHMWDVLGAQDAVLGDEASSYASADTCADCHSDIADDWSLSAMAHAQTSALMEAQLPVTLAENRRLAEELGPDQQALYDAAAKSCINCHAPVGSQFTDDINALLPLDEPSGDAPPAVDSSNPALVADGVACITCHSQSAAPAERAGFGPLAIEHGGSAYYGEFFGPLFDDPNPLPVRVHDLDGDQPLWTDEITSSELCGACHNVAVDIDGDGLSPVEGAEQGLQGAEATSDEDGDFILDQNEVDDSDEDGRLDDLVLQTTYDEWQDYVVGFEERFADNPDQTLDAPLGCTSCHMPTEGDGTEPVVDVAPGLLPNPERDYRSHTFIGVDYDLNVDAYGAQENFDRMLEERQALLQSAVTLDVENVGGDAVAGNEFEADVTVTNNLLGHNFPTGFAFARQFWLEVTATTADGEEVCLVDFGIPGAESACGSGQIDSQTQDLPQCDPIAVADALGLDPAEFSDSVVALEGTQEDCDPWLANFQKILTDGDPDEDGVFEEVPYQSFLGGIVRDRHRIADDLQMRAVNATRLNADLEDQSQLVIPYVFDTSQIADGTEVTVTAELHFRHLPPYFIRALAEAQDDAGDMPESARIDDPDELVGNLVVTDVVTAESGAGPVLACEGPQNSATASILDCLDD
ncbi:MAG: hypothetical protein KDB10_01900 [Acidimicrobiales bacterium]|nr:hypothetical protein [Acidimicrobiales bacterium]MCB9373499.1 hypothetical protein [Microthrixaceae bacterium]